MVLHASFHCFCELNERKYRTNGSEALHVDHFGIFWFKIMADGHNLEDGAYMARKMSMDSDVLDSKTSALLSRNLRHARQSKNLTLRALATSAGCSESLLSKIENGKACPSLPMLHRLVQALDTSIGSLFEANGSERVVSRAGDRTVIDVPASHGHVSIERVTPEAERRIIRCDIIHVDPGAAREGHVAHPGEETGYLIAGELELTVAGQVHRLAAGDAFAFKASQPHSFRNPSANRTSVFWVGAARST